MLPGSCAGLLAGRACVPDGLVAGGGSVFAAVALGCVLDLGGALGGVLDLGGVLAGVLDLGDMLGCVLACGGALAGVLAGVVESGGALDAPALAGTTAGTAFAGFVVAAEIACALLSGRVALPWRVCWGCGLATCSGAAGFAGDVGTAGFAGDVYLAEYPIGCVPWLGACRGSATFGTLRVFAAMSTAAARTWLGAGALFSSLGRPVRSAWSAARTCSGETVACPARAARRSDSAASASIKRTVPTVI